MDLASFAGLLLGLAVVVVSLLIGGVPLGTLVQPEAILIVFGGTLTALLIQFSSRDIQSALNALGTAFKNNDLSPDEVVDTITDAAIYIRTKGVLAVQPLLAHVDVPFLQKGLQMIVDNQPKAHMQAQLTTEMEVQYRTDLQDAKVFEAAGGFSPTMGIIGAIVGLVQVMGMLHSPDQLGHGVANAFIATLYGVGLANLFLLPLAGKLKEHARYQAMLRAMMLHGLMAIREEVHPTLIREQLEAYVAPAEEALAPLAPVQDDYVYEQPVGV